MIAKTAALGLLQQTNTPRRISDIEDAWLTAQDARRPPERSSYLTSDGPAHPNLLMRSAVAAHATYLRDSRQGGGWTDNLVLWHEPCGEAALS
jgi:hypothetical protein